jgi:hypothetical protein
MGIGALIGIVVVTLCLNATYLLDHHSTNAKLTKFETSITSFYLQLELMW